MSKFTEMEIKSIEDQIRYHNDLYWNGKEVEISDIEYDKLVEKLRKRVCAKI